MRIAFVAYPGLTALDLIGPLEVLSRLPDTTCEIVAVSAGPTVTDTGVTSITATRSLTETTTPDIVVVPGGLAGTMAAAQDPALLSWLEDVSETATWMTSVCTGAIILGAVGLLQHRRATTHWALMDQLPRYGATPVEQRVVSDGAVMTAAGVSAGIDMALTLAGLLAGDEVARLIQLGIEYDPHPPYATGSPTAASTELAEVARAVIEQALLGA